MKSFICQSKYCICNRGTWPRWRTTASTWRRWWESRSSAWCASCALFLSRTQLAGYWWAYAFCPRLRNLEGALKRFCAQEYLAREESGFALSCTRRSAHMKGWKTFANLRVTSTLCLKDHAKVDFINRHILYKHTCYTKHIINKSVAHIYGKYMNIIRSENQVMGFDFHNQSNGNE